MKTCSGPHPLAIFAALMLVLSPVFVSDALTPQERKLGQVVKAQIEEGQRQYDGALNDVRNAKQEAAAAKGTAAQTAAELKVAQDKFDAVNKDNARMKPVYDKCTSHWGLGAIAFGIADLTKHLLILIAVIVVLGIGIWILSIAAPVTAPFIMIGLRAVGGVFKGIGWGISAVFGALHRLLTRLIAKLKPIPPQIPPTGATGPTGPTA